MTIATTETAVSSWPCPIARLWGQKDVNPHCRAEGCPAWRWMPLSADDADFKAAVVAKMQDMGGGVGTHGKAVKHVMDNREALGLPTKPTHGFCGLGGRP